MEAEQDKQRCLPPLRAGKYESRDGHHDRKSQVVPQHVVIFREPRQRMRRAACEQLRDDSQSVQIRRYACQRDRGPFSSPKAAGASHGTAHKKMSDGTHISTSTSSPSTLIGYTATFAAGLCATSPVLGSYCQPCHGHITLPSSITPCPSGPPRCRHTLSMALSVPSQLATQMVLSPTTNSRASPSAGNSDFAAMRTRLAIEFVNPLCWFRGQKCRRWPPWRQSWGPCKPRIIMSTLAKYGKS